MTTDALAQTGDASAAAAAAEDAEAEEEAGQSADESMSQHTFETGRWDEDAAAAALSAGVVGEADCDVVPVVSDRNDTLSCLSGCSRHLLYAAAIHPLTLLGGGGGFSARAMDCCTCIM